MYCKPLDTLKQHCVEIGILSDFALFTVTFKILIINTLSDHFS